MKTKEELKELREEYDALTKKMKELTEEELEELTGGAAFDDIFKKEEGPGEGRYEIHVYK